MASLKDLRNKIKSIKSIQQVTNAMKMVAAAKLRKSQENMEKARPYEYRLKKLIHNVNYYRIIRSWIFLASKIIKIKIMKIFKRKIIKI